MSVINLKNAVVAKILFSLLVGVCALPLLAEEVTFSSQALFCAGAGPCLAGSPSILLGVLPAEATFLFQVPVNESVPINTSNVPVIEIGIADIGTNPRVGTGSFTIDITQTAPKPGSKVFTGGLSGSFAVGSSDATITFSKQTIDISGILYTLESPVFTFPLIGPPSRVYPILVDITPNPEPSFFVVTGMAFVGLMFLARRHRRKI
jgi:hypothetical protein